MKKQVADEAQEATVRLMETRDFVVWTDNYAHVIGHVIPNAERGSYTCASYTGAWGLVSLLKAGLAIIS